MAAGRRVLVVAEVESGALSRATSEHLAAGRALLGGDQGELAVALVGHGLRAPAAQAIKWGGERVYTVDDPLLEDLPTDLCLTARWNPFARRRCRKLSCLPVRPGDASWRVVWRAVWVLDCCRIARKCASRPAQRASHGGPACVWRQFPGARALHQLASDCGSSFAGV